VRRFLERVIAEDFAGNGSKCAEATGISQSLISGVTSGVRGMGMMMIERLADYAGVSVDEVLGRDVAPGSARHARGRAEPMKFSELPGWREAEAEARTRYGDRVPAYAFRMAGEMTAPLAPEHVDVFTVRDFAEMWLRNAPEKTRIEAFMAGLNAEIARNEAVAVSRSTSDHPPAVGPGPDALADAQQPPG